jgi:hypothetical protein
MRLEELLSWRQDWGGSSIHPLARADPAAGSWRAIG